MHRRMVRLAALALALAACLATATEVSADRRTDYLIGLLQTSSTFRVRAQAALSLGRLEGNPEIVRALTGALDDDHPAVRTAAAASLERLSDPSALTALRAKSSDGDAGVRRAVASAIRSLERVARTSPTSSGGSSGSSGSEGGGSEGTPSGSARFYVGVGMPGTSVRGLDSNVLRGARDFLVRTVAGMDGVAIAPENESNAAATRVLRDRRLSGFFIDASITQIEENATGLRVVVSVIVGTYPGRDMRAMLNGAATVPGGSGPQARQMALEGALRSALRRLPQAMEQAAGR